MDKNEGYDKLAVIGFGNVGELVVWTSMITNRFREIYIYNRDPKKVNQRIRLDGKFRNLTDALAWYDTKIIQCDELDDLPGDALTVVCIKENYDYKLIPHKHLREVATRKDAPLMRKIAESYAKKAFVGQILMVTNPIGPMAYLFHHFSGIDADRIHPVGTILDTARYVKMLKKHLGRQSALVDTIVIGEHGSNAVFLRSSSTVDGYPISSFGLNLGQVEQDTLSEGLLEARALGYTNMGIVASLLQLFEVLSSPSYPKRLPLGSYYNKVFVELPVKRLDGRNLILWGDIDRREKALLDASVDLLLDGSIKILKDATRQQKKIIIVDDEPDEAASLAMALQKCILDDSELYTANDFDFTVALSGEELIRFIQEQPIGFDLAIVDQRMPGISGLEALLKAREIQPNLDCIILLGKSEAADLQRMFHYDGLRFVEKPLFKPEIYDLCEHPNYTVFKDMLEYTSPVIVR